MVRIFVRALIIFCFFGQIESCAEVTQVRDKFHTSSKANLKNVKLKSIGKYKCDAAIEEVTVYSNEFMLCDKIKIIFFLKDNNVTMHMKRIHSTFENKHYFVAAVDCDIEFCDVFAHAQSILFNTKDNNIIIKNGYNGKYKDFDFYSKNDLTIVDFNFNSTNIFAKNSEWTILIDNLKINHKKEGEIKNLTAKNKDYSMKVQFVQMKKNVTQLQGLTFVKNDIVASAICATMHGIDSIIFEKGITISNPKIKLFAKKARKVDDRILLEEIEYVAMKNINGYSKTGYFDIKNRKLILTNGKIKSSF